MLGKLNALQSEPQWGRFERASERISYSPRPLFIYRMGACSFQLIGNQPLQHDSIVYIAGYP